MVEKKLLVSDITNTIYLANAKQVKGNPDLWETVGDKKDMTDEAIRAVYQWFLNHCTEEESGFYQIRFPGKPWLTMDTRKPKNVEVEMQEEQIGGEEQSKGCEWCCDEILFDGEDMELELQHPLEDAPRMVYPNFCPMCGRPLKGAVDGTAQA